MTDARLEARLQHGERFAYSELTDTWYRVTAWEDHGDGKIVSHSKTEVDREEVPEHCRQWENGRGSDV